MSWREARETSIVTLLFVLLYGWSASAHFLGGDSGLFATIFADGGTAHPPGYPLYSMYLRALSWIPASSPAHGASLATALLGASAVGALYWAAQQWQMSRWASLLGAVGFGLSSHVWLFHTQPEVFALNHLVGALILGMAAPDAPLKGAYRLGALGLLAGLGLSNHHTIVLLTPIGLYGVYRGWSEAEHRFMALLGGAVSLVVGLVPYAYLAWVTQTDAWQWDRPDSLADIVHVFLRRDYGTLSLTAESAEYIPLEQLGFWVRHVPADMLYLPVVVALVGIGYVAIDIVRDDHNGPTGLIWVVVSLVLCGPGFALLLTRKPEGIDSLMLRRFHLLPEMVIAFLSGIGWDRLESFVSRASIRYALVGALAVAGLAVGLPPLQTHHAPTVEQYVRDTFEPLPEDAIVVGTGDHHFFGALYLRRALETRPDLTYIDAHLLTHRWYHRRIDRRLEVDYPYQGSSVDTDELFEVLLETDRPLFVTHAFHDSLLDGWPSAPFGTAIRVYPRAHRPPPPRELFRQHLAMLESNHLDPRPVPEGSWAHYVLDDRADRWRALARALERVEARRPAERARELERLFRPESAPSLSSEP